MNMTKIKKKIAWVLLISLLQIGILHINVNSVQAEGSNNSLNLNVKSAILIEATTGQVLYEYNADEALPPASMAKMMTEYLVLDSISTGKHKWDDQVTASKAAADVIGSGQLIAENEKLSLKDMFSAMSIYSANDASVALAEFIGGTEEKFATMMNDKAKEIGMSDKAHFISATGLSRSDLGANTPKSIDGETLMTARDSAILAQRLLKDHKEVLDFTKIPSQKLRPSDKTPMLNWNWMLEGNQQHKSMAYTGLDGLKTGHTDQAGQCFTGTAERNGLRIISVVMGAPTEAKRFEETRKLLDYGFNNFEFKQVIDANTTIDALKTVPITKGVQKEVAVETKEGLKLIVNKNYKKEDIKITAAPADAKALVAPIKKGDTVGTATISYGGKDTKVELVAKEDAAKASWFRLMLRAVNKFFADLYHKIVG
jgi:serine-type D-Ala-D-Ala carboxypeptidase (penicillin-binding protein 5/6)